RRELRQVEDEIEEEEAEQVGNPGEKRGEHEEDCRLERSSEERGAGRRGERRDRVPRIGRGAGEHVHQGEGEETGHDQERRVRSENAEAAAEEIRGGPDWAR